MRTCSVSLRLTPTEAAAVEQLREQGGFDSTADVIRHALRTLLEPAATLQLKLDELAQLDEVSESAVLVRATELAAWRRAKLDTQPLNQLLSSLFRRHVERYGWPLPPLRYSALQAIRDLQEGGTRAASSHLHSVFPSFWYAGNGPAARALEPGYFERILAYRLGQNKTGEVFDITLAELRRACLVQRRTVSFFQPATAYQLYSRFLRGISAPVVWDPSSGFGARLLAFAAACPAGVYCGNEPAGQTHADLTRLATNLPGYGIKLDNHGSEFGHSALVEASVDLVFTSPPYFGLEHYFDEEAQASMVDRGAWLEQYLRPTLQHAQRYLKPDRLIVLNVNEPEPYISCAADSGFVLERNEVFRVRQDHFSRARGRPAKNECLLIWRKK